MDKATETPTQIKEPSELKESTPIPIEVSSALGRGLRQSFTQPFQQIKSGIEGLKGNKEYAHWINWIKISQEKIEFIINKLEHSKKVCIIPTDKHRENDDAGIHFEFSEETEESNPISGKVTTGEMTFFIIRSLHHTLLNPLFESEGFSELIQTRSGSEKDKNNASLINRASLQVSDKLRSLDGAVDIELLTDNNGETSILPLHPTNTQGNTNMSLIPQ